jgi:hypothetical protein
MLHNFDARGNGSSRGEGRTRVCSVGLGLLIFFFFSSIFLYTTCVLGLCPFAILICNITYKKKKKNSGVFL